MSDANKLLINENEILMACIHTRQAVEWDDPVDPKQLERLRRHVDVFIKTAEDAEAKRKQREARKRAEEESES